MVKNTDEVVFSVSGAKAVLATEITLAEAGIKEREHLQEWVLAHPEISGSGVMIVTFEFDRWASPAGSQKDRLDILGLGRDGRLVVAELKRDRAPETVDMQAIKYAAMASRFSPELLAQYHSRFTRSHLAEDANEGLSDEEARAKLDAWADVGLLPGLLLNPRVVLLAESFPPTVIATAMWLNERGIDLTLMSYHAYRTDPEQVVLTVSQLYPVREVTGIVVRPPDDQAGVATSTYPVEPWTGADLERLAEIITSPVALAVMDLCALRPGEWVGSGDAYARAGTPGTGAMGGFALTIRAQFKRSNPPYENEWAVGGANQAYYRLSPELAEAWRKVRADGIDVPLVLPEVEAISPFSEG